MGGGSSKSLLPLVEILVSIGIFAIAVILTLQLFFLAKFLGDKTSDSAKAVFEAQNIAESIKAMKTAAEIENYIKNDLKGGGIYYDSEWEKTESLDDAAYSLSIAWELAEHDFGGLYKFQIAFSKMEPYPFIDDKKVEKDEKYIPLLASIEASKFVLK